jgi:hypothetical protein
MTCMSIADVLKIILAVGGGAWAFIKWLKETGSANRLKRFDKFQEMRRRTDDPPLSRVFNAIEEGDVEAIKALNRFDKEDFLAFYEELALMEASGLIRTEVAFQMFGFWILEAERQSAFWTPEITRDDPFWRLFFHFHRKMTAFQAKYPNNDWPLDQLKF